MSKHLVVFAAILFLCSSLSAQEQTSEKRTETNQSEVLLADFEESLPEGFKTTDAEAKLESNEQESFAGKGYLKVTIPAGRKEPAHLFFKLPKGINISTCYSLVVSIKTSPRAEAWKLRWYALDEKDKPIFQRVFTFDGGHIWTRMDFPLPLWRWGNLVGDWSEVRSFSLDVETGDGELCLDDLKLTLGKRGEKSALPPDDWLISIAFPEKSRVLLSNGFLLATDAVEQVSEEDFKNLLEKLRPIRDWVRAIFKKASRPFGGDYPVSLLIFRQQSDFETFYKRLGLIWRATINPPKAGGYTVNDISASTYNEKLGINRPVFFHEVVHAVVTREIRTPPGYPRYSWLQEGIANYLQLCLHPESLKREDLIKNFLVPISKEGKTFFKPLEQLLTKPISMSNYAQLATLIGFLVEKHPDYLDSIALNLADGKEIADILKELGTSFDKLEEEWFSWGKKTFAPDSKPPAGEGSFFPVPEQWKDYKKPTPKDETKPEEN